MATLAYNPLDYRHLLRRVARQFGFNDHDREDLEQAGWFALERAAETFDPVVGIPFEEWALIKIRSAARNWKAENRTPIHVPKNQRTACRRGPRADETTGDRDCRMSAEVVIHGRWVTDSNVGHLTGADVTLADVVADPLATDSAEPDAQTIAALEALDALPALERTAVTLRLGLNGPAMLTREVAEAMGCSATSVDRYVNRAFKALRLNLTDPPTTNEEPTMSRLNGYLNPTPPVAAPEVDPAQADTGRCQKCGRRWKNKHLGRCYYRDCEAYATTEAKPAPKAPKRKATKPAAKPKKTKVTRRAPAPKPQPPAMDAMAGLSTLSELAVMQALANLPRAAAERVTAWAACHFGA